MFRAIAFGSALSWPIWTEVGYESIATVLNQASVMFGYELEFILEHYY